MNECLKIMKVEEIDESINHNTIKIINNIKLLVLFAVLTVFCLENGLENESEELLTAGSLLFGTINIISLIKSLCKNYGLKTKKELIENEVKQK